MRTTKKRTIIPSLIVMVAIILGFHTVSAQIAAAIPKIARINKPKQKLVLATGDNELNQTLADQTGESAMGAPRDKCSENLWLQAHLEDIAERQKEVDGYTPGRGWLTSNSNYDHLKFAVSPIAREKWLNDSNALDFKSCPNLISALDKLAVSAAKKLPLYQPSTRIYGLHNLAEERLMKSKINDLADHKIFYAGIQEPNWLIEKNEFGIPKSRYKHGMVWVRYTPNDHPYCRVYYINVIQDYAGGGTYGASYGHFVKDELFGCPAGK